MREWRRKGGKIEYKHVSHEENSWADWLVCVAAHVKCDIDLEEFAEVWPTNGVAPKEVGNILFRAGGDFEPKLITALETVEISKRQKTLQSWVSD